jgi:hypothetical protein
MDSPRLRVIGTVHQAADSGMDSRSRAHGAGLNRGKQFAVAEAVIPESASRLAQRHDFGVSRRIAVAKVAIPTASDHAPLAHHDRSHWHFAGLQGALRRAQGFFHPEFVGCVGCSGQWSVAFGWLPETVLNSQFPSTQFIRRGRLRLINPILPGRDGSDDFRRQVVKLRSHHCPASWLAVSGWSETW